MRSEHLCMEQWGRRSYFNYEPNIVFGTWNPMTCKMDVPITLALPVIKRR